MKILISLSWTLSLILMFLKHPVSVGSALLFQTITVSLMTGPLNLSFWYSYILFLIMIGGMMILFIYMTSIASNEKFKLSNKMILLFNLLFITFYFKSFYINTFFNLEDLNFSFLNLKIEQMTNKFMYIPMNFIFMLIILYLFITLIAVVKITDLPYGPLRQKF